MERTEKSWLDWLVAEALELIHQPIVLKKRYPKEYQRILQVVGNWVTVENKLERYRAGKYQPAEVLSEELKALKCDIVPDQEVPEGNGVLKRERPEKPKQMPKMRLLSVRKIDENFKMPEPNPRYAKTKYSDIYYAKPYSSVVQPLKPRAAKKAVEAPEDVDVSRGIVQNEKEDEKMTELTKVGGLSAKPRKERIVMSDSQMREFVLEAMKTLGERPSKIAYDAYAKEHGGVTAASLVHHGLGISQWPRIAAEERAKVPEAVPNSPEEPAQRQSEEMTPPGDVALQEEEKSPVGSAQQGRDVLDILQVMVHGIDATVVIGDLEVQVRLDFGSKK